MSDTKDRKTKECSLDKQNQDKNYNIKTINSIDVLKECVLKVIDDITPDIMFNIVGVDYVSIKLNINNYLLQSDIDLCYLRLETDCEYKSRLEFEIKGEENALLVVKLQAKKLGYKLEKITNE